MAKPKRDHTGRLLPKARADGIVPAGLLKRDGGHLDRPLFAATLSPEVETVIYNYRPRQWPWCELWPIIQAFVLGIVLSFRPPTVASARHSMVAVTRFAGWAVQRGLELDVEVLFQPVRVEEFAATAEIGENDRKNMRSRLRAIGREVTRDAPWPTEPTRISRLDMRPPYSKVEVDLLERDIEHQYKTIKRAAKVVHHLGLGAGLRARVLRVVSADDLGQRHGRWCVRVHGANADHFIPILLPHVPAVLKLAEEHPDGPLIHDWAHRKTVGAMLQDFRQGNSTPKPNSWRYRSTWLLSHLALGTRLDVLKDAAGVREQRGLIDLLQYLPLLDDAEITHMLAGPEA